MADVNANIGVNIDTSNALSQLKALQRQIAQFHTSIAKSSETAAFAQRDLQRNFLNSVNSIGAFSAELRTVRTTSETFTNSLEKNKFSMREYFRYAGASTKTFGRLFKSEYDTIGKVAEDRVKKLQTQYIKMGRDASGAMRAIAIMPNELNLNDFSTQTQLAAQKQAVFNQLMKQGSTNLLNFGKNTQWAGRQLMVGFTLPLMAVGAAASKSFMDMEAQALKFRKVYGDLFTPKEESQQALENIIELGKQFTQYGVAVSATVGLAADAAAAGFSGIDLQRQTAQATRLSVLGQIESQKALETTISLQNAFAISSENLADSINFLNAVENQTVVSLDDITTAIPKVAPVIMQLGGDVKDLAFFMTAMKEGGINASEGANALKSGLASLINPSSKAAGFLESMGINIDKIVESNAGNVKQIVIDFANALNTLDPLNRARAIEQMFGKFQFARLSTLFQNVIKDGTQASRVLDLAGASIEDLSSLAEEELGVSANSAMNKFKKAVEDLKLAIVPVGQAFLEAVTPLISTVGSLLEKFSDLSSGTKKAITLMVTVVGGLGPVLLMTFGLLANGVANIIKLFLTLRTGYLRLTGQSRMLGEQTQYMTNEQLEAAAAAHSLNQAHAVLTQQFTAEASAVRKLIEAYQAAIVAASRFAAVNPGMMIPPRGGTRGKGFAKGGIVRGPGGPTGDKIPIMASDGEAVISAKAVNDNKAVIDNLLKTGKFESKLDLTGAPGNAARSSFSYSGVNRLLRGEGMPGATVGTPGNMPPVAAQAGSELATKATKLIGQKNKELAAEFGSNKQVNVPNAYASGHFGGPQQMSGTALLAHAQANSSPKQVDNITAMIAKSKDGVNSLFNVFDNRVVAISDELNSLVNKTGSGRTAPISLARTDLITNANVRDTELVAQMQKAGRPIEEIKAAVASVTREIEQGFIPLVNETEITAEQIDNIVREAYEKVARANDHVDAAYQEMKKITAYADPTARGGRQNREDLGGSYKGKRDIYGRNMEVMAGGEKNIPYATKGAFQITPFIAQEARSTTAELQSVYNQLSKKVRTELSQLNGDVELFTKRLLDEAKEAGIAGYELGSKAVTGIAKGAQTQSPSKKTILIGEDIARGLQVGMEKQKSNVSTSGASLANAAISGAQSGRRSSGRPQGAPASLPLSQLSSQIVSAPKTEEQIKKFGTALGASTPRIANMNNALMGGTFALTSLAGVAQMFGGRLGKISNIIFSLSGGLFALMSITQLLTQAKAADLLMTRIGIAKSAGANALASGSMFGGLSKAISGRAGLVGIISRVGIRLAAFLGPVGLAVAAIGTLAVGFKLINDASARSREKIEGLGNAALLTDNKLKGISDFFGIKPQKTRLERTGPQLVLNQETRSRVDELRESEGFKKDFGKDINALKGATDKQAQLVLQSLSIQLKGKGFAKDQIDIILKSLQEESGKTNLKLDFSNIDLSTKKGQDNLAKSAEALGKSFGTKFGKGYSSETSSVFNRLNGEIITFTKDKLSAGLEKSLGLTSKAFAGMINGLSGQLDNGSITAKQFNQSFETISSTIENMPKPQAIMLMDNIIKNLPGPLAKTALGIKNVKDQMLIAQAAALGIANITPAMIKALQVAATSSDNRAGSAAMRVRRQIKEDMKAIQEVMAIVNGQPTPGKAPIEPKTGSDVLSKEAKLTIARLQKELDLLKTKKDSVNEINSELKRQYDYQKKIMELQKSAVEAKISGDFIGAALIQQQQSFEAVEFNRETDSLSLEKKITALENKISGLQAGERISAADKALNKARSKGKAMGGLIKGPGSGTSDSILARFSLGGLPQLTVSNGEYVVRASSVKNYGVGFMDAINNQELKASNNNTSAPSSNTVYNIDMVVNGGSANANEIADQVIRKINTISSKNNKSNAVMM